MSEKKDTSAMGRVDHYLRVYDHMTSSHFGLSEMYHRWATAENAFELILSVILCGCTFLDVDKYEVLKKVFSSIDLSLVIGISSMILFAFTLFKQSVNHNQRCEQHKMAGKFLAQAKSKLRLKQNEWTNEKTEDAVINAYLDQLISTINDLPQIPEKYFIKFKHRSLRKVEFSKFVDKHRTAPWLWCKFLFLLKGFNLYKEKEEKSKSKTELEGDQSSAQLTQK